MFPKLKTGLYSIALASALACGVTTIANAETLGSDRRVSVVLDDGTEIVLYGAAGRPRNGKIDYYYLPPALKLSTTQSGDPEFLFMQYTSDSEEGLSGGLLHFLVEWGLTPEQETELAAEIDTLVNGRLAGAATLFPSSDNGPGFSIVTATLGDETTGGTIRDSGYASLLPGGKAAMATRLNSDGAQILAASFDEDAAITDVSAVMNMEYAVQVQGVEGTVTMEWERIEEESEEIFAEYTRTIDPDARQETRCIIIWCNTENVADYVHTYEELTEQFEFLEENEYVHFDFVQGDIPEEIAAPIRDAFIQYFISAVTKAATPQIERDVEDEEQSLEERMGDIRQGAGYTYDVERVRESTTRGKQTLELDMKLSVRYPLTIVGNMKDWYDAAADDPFRIKEIRLDNPFFQFRDIVFLLDGDVRDMFDDHVNAVSVEIRKERDGNDFVDSIAFTPDTLSADGNLSRITYSRGNDPDSGTYEYRVNWNFRGGIEHIEPAAGWKTGSWEGVTLAAPIEARTIEVEADLDELSDIGVTRVTAQIRYPILGEEQEENIQLSVSRDQPIVEEKIFTDRGAGGYAVRLVFHHRRLGRLALPWSARGTDDYIFASVPEEWLDALSNEDSEDPAVVEAQDAVDAENGDQLARFDILTEEE